MRKCLLVVAGIMLLVVMSWAQDQPPAPAQDQSQAPPSGSSQAPTSDTQQPQNPNPTVSTQETIPLPATKPPSGPPFPRTELFGGYSFAQAGFFNAGHWAQLNGWNASLGFNVAPWLGFLVDGSQYFGNTPIPTATPAPFPNCLSGCPPGVTFKADTQEYNVVFGVQLPYRKYRTWTPFGEVLVGHDGVSGSAILGYRQTEVSSGLAILAGAGADHKITERFAMRVKIDYLQTRTDFPLIGKAKQDNFRVSVGVVLRSVKKKKRTLDETEPEP